MPEKRLFLGIDGGGSKTAALALDDTGHVVGRGLSGPANYQTTGIETTLTHIREAATQALKGQKAAVGVFCLAGADLPPDFAVLTPALRTLDLCQELTLYNDVLAVFRAGSTQAYGVAVVCGSGFNAGGIGRDGREVRFPALGAVTGDRAGGYDIGESALQAAFRAWDGRGPITNLGPVVLASLGVPDMSTLAEWLLQERVSWQQICDLTPLVFDAAVDGDAVASAIIREQGREIGVSILALLRRLDLLAISCEAVLGGSVFQGRGPLLLDTIRETVRPAAPLAQLKRLDVQPVVGAALLALDRAGIVFDEQDMIHFRVGLPSEFVITNNHGER